MKTNFLLLNFVFFTFQTFAQDNIFKNSILPVGNTNHYQSALLRKEATKVSLDSIVVKEREKNVYSYDENGYIKSEIDYYWSDSKWIMGNKIECSNDSKGNIILIISYRYDLYSNSWIKMNRYEFQYDSIGHRTLNALYTWNEGRGVWIGNNKEEYSYDISNNLISRVTYIGERQIREYKWPGFIKSAFTYDIYGNLTSMTDVYWDGNISQWSTIPFQTINLNNTLDSNNKIILSIGQNEFSNNVSKTEYNYDTYGNEVLKVSWIWDTISNKWMPKSKEERSFDKYGNQTLFANYIWNLSLSQWVTSVVKEKSFDFYKNKIVYTEYNWNTSTNTLLNSIKNDYEFDTTFFANSFISTYLGIDVESKENPLINRENDPFMLGNGFKYKVTNYVFSYLSNGEWVENRNYKFYYSNNPIVTGIEDQSFIASQKNVVKIYNQLGLEVKPEQVMSGLYIYQYSDGSTRKVMRQE